MVQEDIIVRIVVKDDAGNKIKEINKTVKDLGGGVEETKEQVFEFEKGQRKLSKTTDTLTKGTRRFRAELLSVLFFGMAISRVFFGILRPALELVGVFQILTQFLQVFFLPTALDLLKVVTNLQDKFIEQDEAIQKSIGVFLLFLGTLGLIATFLAIVGLGVFGLAQVFGVTIAIMFGFTSAIFLIIGAIAVLGTLFLRWNTIAKKTKVIIFGVAAAMAALLAPFLPLIAMFFAIIAVGIAIIAIWKNWHKMSLLMKFALVFLTGGIALIIPIIQNWGNNLDMIVEKLKAAWEWVKKLGDRIKNSAVGKFIGGVVAGVASFARRIIHGGRSRQFGGFIPQDGLFKLHAGEQVVPSNQSLNFNPSIVINVNRESDSGIIDRLKAELNESFARGLGNLARR